MRRLSYKMGRVTSGTMSKWHRHERASVIFFFSFADHSCHLPTPIFYDFIFRLLFFSHGRAECSARVT